MTRSARIFDVEIDACAEAHPTSLIYAKDTERNYVRFNYGKELRL